VIHHTTPDGTPPNDGEGGAEASTEACTGSALFAQVWSALAEVLGPATTATLFRRGVKYASAREPLLKQVEIKRDGFEYRYALPASWDDVSPETNAALRALIEELWRLLVPLTGRILVRRLENLPDLCRCGLLPPEGSR